MNDNEVLMVVIGILITGLPAIGIRGVSVKQSYQPRKTGTETGPAVYLHKISAARYGFPGKKDVFNTETQDFDHIETIWRTPTWQVDALSIQDPTNLTQLTASDIVEATADVLQQSSTRTTLLNSNIGIERITDIREGYFADEYSRYEQRPSFDFTLTYRREFSSTVPDVTDHILNVNRIC